MGRHVADAALWIAIASFLATFSVRKALDEHGKEIPVVPKFTTGITMFVNLLYSIPSSGLSISYSISVIPRHFLAEFSRDSMMYLWRI